MTDECWCWRLMFNVKVDVDGWMQINIFYVECWCQSWMLTMLFVDVHDCCWWRWWWWWWWWCWWWCWRLVLMTVDVDGWWLFMLMVDVDGRWWWLLIWAWMLRMSLMVLMDDVDDCWCWRLMSTMLMVLMMLMAVVDDCWWKCIIMKKSLGHHKSTIAQS